MRPPMTDQQKEVYKFIERFWELEERCPSIREIAKGQMRGRQEIKVRSSTATVYGIIQRLVEKNYLVEDWWVNRKFWRVAS